MQSAFLCPSHSPLILERMFYFLEGISTSLGLYGDIQDGTSNPILFNRILMSSKYGT